MRRSPRGLLPLLPREEAGLLGLLLGYALPGQPPGSSPSHDLLAVLGSTPPGALCARPEFCYLKVNLK